MSRAASYNYSVIIGKVSTQDKQRLLDSLTAIQQQRGDFSYEIIVAERHSDDISQKIQQLFPEVKLLTCNPGTTLPELRTQALHRASGSILIVTEDHCIPADNWFTKIAETFERAPANTVAVGGPIDNGLPLSRLDWATFLCEYSYFLSPMPEGVTSVLAGGNIAYRREALDDIDEATLVAGFWETHLHPLLLERGYRLLSSNTIVVSHKKKFSLKLFAVQRFFYSRYYAGTRFGPGQSAKRLLAACMCPLLPPLVLYRIMRNVRTKRRVFREFVLALPYLLLFTVVWAIGEFWGYLFGAGTALATIE